MRSRRRRHAFLLAALAGVLVAGVPARAEEPFYRYVDENGVVHLTNVPTDSRFAPLRLEPFGATVTRARIRPRPDSRAYDHVISEAARRHGLPPALVKAVVATESSFDARAVSHKGAMGLMQLMPSTAARLGVRDPFHPSQNVHGGARYLRRMLDRYENWVLALAAYNAGPKAVDRYRGVPPYRETRQYVRRVIHYYRRYYGDFS